MEIFNTVCLCVTVTEMGKLLMKIPLTVVKCITYFHLVKVIVYNT